MQLGREVGALVRACRRDISDCIAAGAVDLSSGMMLSSDTLDDHSSDAIELLAAATVELLQGRAVRLVEQMRKGQRGVTDDGHYFQEIVVNSTNSVHLFLRSTGYPDIAVGIVCTTDVKVGLLFAQARRIVRDFDAG
jgi:hypothetical protein